MNGDQTPTIGVRVEAALAIILAGGVGRARRTRVQVLRSHWRDAERRGPDCGGARGWLLDIVREVWDDPDLYVRHRQWDHDGNGTWVLVTKSGPCTCGGGHWYGVTEVDSMTVALEAKS